LRIAHFSDTHIGFRAYHSRITDGGHNQREADVWQTFDRVLDDIVAHEPEVILHTGDFFDKVRPGNHAVIQSFRKLARVQSARAGLPFLIVAGNHDTPASADKGCMLRLFGDVFGTGSIPGVYVVDSGCGVITLDDFGLSVVCIPSAGLRVANESAIRATGAKVNVLAAHGIDASLPIGRDFRISDFSPDSWTYVALGDYHIHHAVRPNAVYSGSTEFTSTNIWEETTKSKGWVLVDGETGKWEFKPVKVSRRIVDLPTMDARGLSGAEIGERILACVDWDEEEQPIVRLRIANVSLDARAEIPNDVFREVQSRCLSFLRELSVQSEAAGGVITAKKTLKENWREFAASRQLPSTIVREEFISTGEKLIAGATNDSEEA
jgi:DNA repair exonuclease SbcCD nuclease subunit